MLTKDSTPQEVQAAWITALRSGKYEQGIGELKRLNRYCCLGLLAELAVKAGLEVREDYYGNSVEFDGRTCTLPSSVMEWAGLLSTIGRYQDTALAWQNDKGVDFNTIANIIESKPEGLFTV